MNGTRSHYFFPLKIIKATIGWVIIVCSILVVLFFSCFKKKLYTCNRFILFKLLKAWRYGENKEEESLDADDSKKGKMSKTI